MKVTWKLYLGIFVAMLVYVIGFSMMHIELWNPVKEAYSTLSSVTKTKFWGEFFFQSASLLLTIFVLKFLLGMEPFKNAIKGIFSEIFSEQEFLVGFDKESLRKISKNINLANNDIDFIDKQNHEEFVNKIEPYLVNFDKESLLKIAKNIHVINKDIQFLDKTQDNESVLKLQKYFINNEDANKEKNYLVIESNYNTTLLASGIEIMHRKIKCKIINDGEFKHEFLFTTPNEGGTLDHSVYENTKNKDRFTEISYNCMLKSSILDDGLSFKDILSNGKIEEEDAVSILFNKKHTVVGEILDIEFSISHPFELTDEADIKNYYRSIYTRPHAVRKITFQIERYQEEKSDLIPEVSPVLYSNDDKLIKAKYAESIFYKTYSWEIFYSQDDCEKISLSIE